MAITRVINNRKKYIPSCGLLCGMRGEQKYKRSKHPVCPAMQDEPLLTAQSHRNSERVSLRRKGKVLLLPWSFGSRHSEAPIGTPCVQILGQRRSWAIDQKRNLNLLGRALHPHTRRFVFRGSGCIFCGIASGKIFRVWKKLPDAALREYCFELQPYVDGM